MARIQTIPPEQAEGVLKDIYADELKSLGYVSNNAQAFSLRPEVFANYRKLMSTIRGNMRLRRYELVTLAASLAMHCRY